MKRRYQYQQYLNFKRRKMWFFVVVIGMIIAYISGRKWGLQIYNYYRPQIAYILPYARRKYRSTSLALHSVDSSSDINVKKKFDLETVIHFLGHIWNSHNFV